MLNELYLRIVFNTYNIQTRMRSCECRFEPIFGQATQQSIVSSFVSAFARIENTIKFFTSQMVVDSLRQNF